MGFSSHSMREGATHIEKCVEAFTVLTWACYPSPPLLSLVAEGFACACAALLLLLLCWRMVQTDYFHCKGVKAFPELRVCSCYPVIAVGFAGSHASFLGLKYIGLC